MVETEIGIIAFIYLFVFNCVSLCAIALPPPPALDEEAPANYFNLDPSTSPAVMNIALPPPPGINPPPPGKNFKQIDAAYNVY